MNPGKWMRSVKGDVAAAGLDGFELPAGASGDDEVFGGVGGDLGPGAYEVGQVLAGLDGSDV